MAETSDIYRFAVRSRYIISTRFTSYFVILLNHFVFHVIKGLRMGARAPWKSEALKVLSRLRPSPNKIQPCVPLISTISGQASGLIMTLGQNFETFHDRPLG